MSKAINFLLAAAVFAGSCTSPQSVKTPATNRPESQTVAHHTTATAPPKNRLIVSLLPSSSDGEFILERNVTAITQHRDQVRSDGSLLEHSFQITSTPQDIDVVRVPNNLTPENCIKAIVAALDDHVKKYGTLSILEIVGHGRTNTMALGENSPLSPTVDNKQILKGIVNYQTANNIQVADTVLLGGCGVMSQLSHQDAKDYNNFARRLKSKIIGSTITVSAEAFNDKGIAGLYAVFDGSKSVAVDTALSHVDYYIRDRQQSGNDSVYYESPAQIKQNSHWMELFNRSSRTRQPVSSLLHLKL